VYVAAGAIPAWTFYSTDWSRPDRERVKLLNRLAAPGGQAFENAPSRGHPVGPDEGNALRNVGPVGEELLGIPSGIESRGLVGPTGDIRPDSGWATREAERIHDVACPGVWILLSQLRDVETEHLLDALQRAGGRRTFFDEPNGAVLTRFEFDSASGGARSSHCAARGEPR